MFYGRYFVSVLLRGSGGVWGCVCVCVCVGGGGGGGSYGSLKGFQDTLKQAAFEKRTVYRQFEQEGPAMHNNLQT